MSKKPETVINFILNQLKSHPNESPLVVGVQGPQGSGKSYLSHLLDLRLNAGPYNIKTVVISLDDFYLTFSEQSALSIGNPKNPLLSGRGPAGTHDLKLALEVLRKLKTRHAVTLPIYDKSLQDGRGDRVSFGKELSLEDVRTIRVIIFEGWMVGFAPLTERELIERWNKAPETSWAKKYDLEVLLDSNRRLKMYQKLWNDIDCFVQIKPEQMDYVWEWRLEQEHEMKAKNGGKGMSDEQVSAFIARYMPSYELFQGGITEGWSPDIDAPTQRDKTEPSWKGRGLQLWVGFDRQVLRENTF